MAGTRSSARQAEKANSSSPSANSSGGTKRKAEDPSPRSTAKRGRPSKGESAQRTLEETMPAGDEHPDGKDKGKDGKQINDKRDDSEVNGKDDVDVDSTEELKTDQDEAAKESEKANGFDHVKADVGDDGKTKEGNQKTEENKSSGKAELNAVEDNQEREKTMPSNILEKGIVYFFTRGRVGVDDPDSVQDLARSYFVLRPLPAGAQLTEGAIPDLKNNRLIALPKKVWPKSGKDRFMAFVEKAETTNQTLKEEFFAGSSYTTKTTGTNHTPDITPIGEGVYAITSTGGGQGTTHLAYMLTIPEKLGEVQTDVGLAAKGSFVLSMKNPEAPGPANAQLPQGPGYPKEIIEEFRGRGWMPAKPKHLDYANAQMLLIGEDFDGSSNLDPSAKDERDGVKETPQEELEKLEGEDEMRVERLKGNDTIFADLDISSKEYPKVMTTW